MLDDSKEAGIGHNSGADLPYDVTKFQPLELRAREIADAGADWIKLPKIETEEQAQKANDFLAQVKKIEKDADRDYWLSAREAKEYGLIDEVLSKRGK